ncbi:unnamed protein product, partial [Allacma fusca]
PNARPGMSKTMMRLGFISFPLLAWLALLNIFEAIKIDVFSDFLANRLAEYQVTVFLSRNSSSTKAKEVFTQRNHNLFALRRLDPRTISPKMEQMYEFIYLLDATKQSWIFIPQTLDESQYYLRMTLNWAYKAPKLDDRLNRYIIFSLVQSHQQSLQEFFNLLQELTMYFALEIGKTQYLYPTAMERLYVVTGNSTDVTVHEIYTLGRRDSVIFRIVEVPLEKMGLFTIRRYNFHGAALAIAIVKNAFSKDLVAEWNEKTNQTVLISGLSYDVITALKDALNFSTDVSIYARGWNEILYNSSYREIGKVLFEEKEDILILKSTYIVARARNFKILVPHHIQGIYAYFLKPSVGSNVNIFWSLLRPRVWVALVGILVVIAASKIIMDAIVEKLEQTEETSAHVSAIIKDDIMWLIGLVTQQASPPTPTIASMRVLIFFASMFSLICFVALTAKLTSALTITFASIKTFFELIRTNIRIAADQDSIVARYTIEGEGNEFRFDQTNAMILKRNHDKFCDMTEGAKLLLAGHHTFIGYEDVKTVLLNQFNRTADDFCRKISSLPVHNLPFRSGMIATQKFPYKEFFNVKLIVLIQSGLLKRFNNHFAMDYATVSCNQADGRLLELKDIYFAHLILITGNVLSALMCLFERLFHRRTELSTQNRTIMQFYA